MITIPIVVPQKVEVVVASFGGVGTTFLMDYIAKYKKTNFPCDRDLIKHSCVPPISFNQNIRFIYVYGDPILATISLFRRGYHHWQSEKLRRYNGDANGYLSLKTTLEEYAALKKDKLGFSTHFYNWYEKYLVHPTMFIRYESIFDNVEAVVDFLGLPKSAVENFPQKKQRQSSTEEISPIVLSNLREMYGSFSDNINDLPEVEIRLPTENKSLTKTYLSSPYPQIVVNNLLDFRLLARNNSFQTYKELRKIKRSLLKSNTRTSS